MKKLGVLILCMGIYGGMGFSQVFAQSRTKNVETNYHPLVYRIIENVKYNFERHTKVFQKYLDLYDTEIMTTYSPKAVMFCFARIWDRFEEAHAVLDVINGAMRDREISFVSMEDNDSLNKEADFIDQAHNVMNEFIEGTEKTPPQYNKQLLLNAMKLYKDAATKLDEILDRRKK